MRSNGITKAVIVLLCALSCFSYAKTNNGAEFFTFKTRAVKTSEGMTGARTIRIERAPDQYKQNAIIIKTRKQKSVSNNGRTFAGSSICNTISDLNIQQIVSPLASLMSIKDDRFGLSNIFEVYFDSPVDPFDICKNLMQNPEVEYASPIYKRETLGSVNDPGTSQQYFLEEMNADEAWEISTGSEEVTIAIVDSGVQTDHPDLAANIWTNPGEIPNDNIDNDNNGKVDDIHGWDFVGNVSQAQISGGQWAEDNNPSPSNPNLNHGTHVAGCAAAVTNNELGVASLGYKCKIIPVKCGSEAYTQGIYRGYAGIAYAASLGADIINCSWGGPGQAAYEQEIIDQATLSGSLVLSSAGNAHSFIDLSPTFPTNYKNVLAVGATSEGGDMTFFSNYGRSVHVFAPGDNILSTLPRGNYGYESGTSMSCPIVAGLAGLIKSVHPDWIPEKIFTQIRVSAVKVAEEDNMNGGFYCRANAARALKINNPINNPDGNNSPGLKLDYYGSYFDSDYALENFKDKDFEMGFINYLSDAKNLVVELQPLNDFIEFGESKFEIGDLESEEEEEIATTIRLKENTPWASGYAQILVKYSADGYEDFEMIKIKINTNIHPNFLTLKKNDFAPDFTTWTDIESVSGNIFWIAGAGKDLYQGYLTRLNKSGTDNVETLSSAIQDIELIDNKTAFMAAKSHNGKTKIAKTSDYGQNWDSYYVDSVTSLVNKVKCYDASHVFAMGNPKNNLWFTFFSSNAGESWLRSASLKALEGEESNLKANCFLGADVYFASNEGRVFHSENGGFNWEVAAVLDGKNIQFVQFADRANGILIYTDKNNAEHQYLARTKDGGINWELNAVDFGLETQIINVMKPDDSKSIFIATEKGEIYYSNDLFATKTAVISNRVQQVNALGMYANNGNASVLQVGNYITSLDFKYDKESKESGLYAIAPKTMNFGFVKESESKTKEVTLFAYSDSPITIENAYIENVNAVDGEFVIDNQIPNTLAGNNTFTVGIKFSPKSETNREAQLVVLNNTKDKQVLVNLKGSGDPNSSVESVVQLRKAIESYPSPVKDEVTFKIQFELTNQFADLEIIDINGKKIARKEKTEIADKKVTFDCSDISSGTYFANFTIDHRKYIHKFIISK